MTIAQRNNVQANEHNRLRPRQHFGSLSLYWQRVILGALSPNLLYTYNRGQQQVLLLCVGV